MDEIREPFSYLLVAMDYAKAALKNGGIVNMMDVENIIEFGFGEGEMFYRDFLAKFGKVDDWGINDENFDKPEKWKPVNFELNEKGRVLGQMAQQIEDTFQGEVLSPKQIAALIKKYNTRKI